MILAHGIGGRQDLPISFSFLLAGASLAVLVSFLALGFVWQKSRFHADAGRPVPGWLTAVADSRVLRALLAAFGLVATAATVVAAAAGPGANANPAPWTIYILFWVGIVPLSLLFGPVWKLLNPLRTLHRGIALLSGGKPLAALPAWVGYWPSAVGLFAFTWMELVPANRTDGPALLTWFAVYATITLVASTVFGAAWFDKADPFETYSNFIGRLAPIGRRPSDGRLVFRNPFDGLVGLPEAPGLVMTIAVMLGSTAYDGFSRNIWWITQIQSGVLPKTLYATLGLVTLIALVAVTYWACTRPIGPTAPMALAHSLIPIAVGYVLAHYLTLLITGTQQALINWSDPLGTGHDYLSLANFTVDPVITDTTSAALRAGAVVLGHVLGVFAAHDRAIALLPRRRALTGQLPLLVLMVLYTIGGLTLLFTA
ncbi:hypothetical protein GCM10027589_32840 [Actinocorallia lasiicapitis]